MRILPPSKEEKKQIKIKKKAMAARKYQLELKRKPKYLREYRRLLPFALIAVLVINFLFTLFGMNSYLSFAQEQIECGMRMARDYAFTAVNWYGGGMDFSQIEKKDGLYQSIHSDATVRKNTNEALGMMHYGFNEPYPYYGYTFFSQLVEIYSVIQRDYFNGEVPIAYESRLYNLNGECLSGLTEDKFMYFYLNRKSDYVAQTKEDRQIRYMIVNLTEVEKHYPGLYDELKDIETYDDNNGLYRFMYVDEFYHNGNSAIPKNIKIYETDDFNSFYNPNGELIPTEVIDLSKCDTTGYEEYDYSLLTGIPATLVVNNYKDKENVHKTYMDQSTALSYTLQKIHNGRTAGTYQEETVLPWSYSAIDIQQTEIPDLVAVTAVDYNFFRDCKGVLTIMYLLITALILAVFAIIAYIRLNQKRTAYEVDAYRRRTTNAMAHDLKSPLMAISGYAENLCEMKETQSSQNYGQKILLTVSEMDQMIANILDLSRLEENQISLNKLDIHLEDLVNEQISNQSSRMKEKNLSVNCQGAGVICADKEWMNHLILNLVSNAVKYAKENTEINIFISSKELKIVNEFDYKMDVEANRLTEPFVKGEGARSNTEGNGLGLSIAHNIAMAHGYEMLISANNQIFEIKLVF